MTNDEWGDDAAKRVDMDVTGAKTLEVAVGDGGNGILVGGCEIGALEFGDTFRKVSPG